MQTLTLQTMILKDGRLHVEVPCRLPPGPAEVVIVATSFFPKPLQSLRGIWKGKINENFDIQLALKEFRHEWEKEWGRQNND